MNCYPKEPPRQHRTELLNRARAINPANAVVDVGDPQRIAVVRSKYFGPNQRVLTVSFMESTNRDLRNKILAFANMWQCGITFEFTQRIGDIRISRGRGGYYSYLGTDILSIPRNRQTMNLEAFTMNTRESEWHRVVTHEFAHSLGGPHEHARREIVARIDPQKAYAYFRRTSGWNRNQVDSQVLTPLNENSLIATEADETSILAYQLPASIMMDGQAVPGGTHITDADREFMQNIYPTALEPVDPDPVDPDPVEPLPDGTEWDDIPFTDNDWT